MSAYISDISEYIYEISEKVVVWLIVILLIIFLSEWFNTHHLLSRNIELYTYFIYVFPYQIDPR